MPRRIADGLPDTLSRQRRWAIRQEEEGRCRICGQLAGGSVGLCTVHTEDNRRRSRLWARQRAAARRKILIDSAKEKA